MTMPGMKEATQAISHIDYMSCEQVFVPGGVQPNEDGWILLLQHTKNIGLKRVTYCFVFKRWFDTIIAACLLVVLSPLLLLVAIIIQLRDGGSPLFRQIRIGQNGRPFVMYKFRTMIPDRRIAQMAFHGSDRRVRHKTTYDPRVTRMGRFLRRTSIDELPQLINVVRGEMSLVGPRPELPEIVMHYAPWQHQRHLVKPGLTGWWQIQGRSDLPMHEHTELDIYYVMNQSFRLDIQVLMQTFRILLSRSGAF